MTSSSAGRHQRVWVWQPLGGVGAAERGRTTGGIGEFGFVMGMPMTGQARQEAEMRPRSAREVKGFGRDFLERTIPQVTWGHMGF